MFTNGAVKAQHVLFVNEPFSRRMLVFFLSLVFFYTVKKNLVGKLCKVLEMELKRYTPVGPKFIFQKIKFDILHYIQHDFICQRLGLSKGQTSMFKRVTINYLLRLKDYEILLRTHSDGSRRQIFLFYNRQQKFFLHKSRCCKCSLEIKLFINLSHIL